MSKINIFLGAFINQTNAQNLSCRALAAHLDSAKFEVYTLSINHGNLVPLDISSIHVFNCRYPVRISGVLGFIWGFYHADVVYLPRGLFLKWQMLLVRIFKVKTFKTVRNVIDDQALKSAMSQLIKPTKGDLKRGYNFVDRVYSMTSYMADYNSNRWGIHSEKEILLPPSEIEMFQKRVRIRKDLRGAIFIGNDWGRKGLKDYLELASQFPELVFHVVGKGDLNAFRGMYSQNVHFHGLLTDNDLVELIAKSDIHILPSRSEGLPRVLIETMANGLPSILYKGYGAEEFVKNGVNGYVLDDLAQIHEILKQIKSKQISLESLSQNCIVSSLQFDPKELTRNYERVIEDLYAS